MNLDIQFPNDYLSYVNNMDKTEITSDSGYIELFKLNELEQINKEYETNEAVPNFVAIGTNGGGIGIFFNKQNKYLYSIPFIGMEENDAVLLAKSFSEFIYKFEVGELEIY